MGALFDLLVPLAEAIAQSIPSRRHKNSSIPLMPRVRWRATPDYAKLPLFPEASGTFFGLLSRLSGQRTSA